MKTYLVAVADRSGAGRNEGYFGCTMAASSCRKAYCCYCCCTRCSCWSHLCCKCHLGSLGCTGKAAEMAGEGACCSKEFVDFVAVSGMGGVLMVDNGVENMIEE